VARCLILLQRSGVFVSNVLARAWTALGQGKAWRAEFAPRYRVAGINHTKLMIVTTCAVAQDAALAGLRSNARVSRQEPIMIQLITCDRYEEFSVALGDMHRLRYRVFKDRLGWDVETTNDMEVDEFDSLEPSYLLLQGQGTGLLGCVRLLPSSGPTMLRDAFPALLPNGPIPSAPDVWESSRFALDIHRENAVGALGVASATYELFAGMVEFGLAKSLSKILTVTDVRMERILRRANWPLERLGPARQIGKTNAVAGYLTVSQSALSTLREAGGFNGPVLWAPVLQAA